MTNNGRPYTFGSVTTAYQMPSNLRCSIWRLLGITSLVSVTLGLSCLLVQAQPGKSAIKIVSPKVLPNRILMSGDGSINVRFTLSDDEVDHVVVKITTEHEAVSKNLALPGGDGERIVKLPLFRGENKIEMFTARNRKVDKTAPAKLTAVCDDESCGTAKYAIVIKNVEEGDGDVDDADDADDAVPEAVEDAGQDDDKPKKAGLKISGADQLPPQVDEAQVAFTKTNPNISYLRLIDANSDEAKRINFPAGGTTIATNIKLVNDANLITAYGYDSNHKKLAEATKQITATIAAAAERVTLGKSIVLQNDQSVTIHAALTDPSSVITRLYYRVTDSNGFLVAEGVQDRIPGVNPQPITFRTASGANNIYVAARRADGSTAAEARNTIQCVGTCGGESTGDPRITLTSPSEANRQSDTEIVVIPTDSGLEIATYSYEVRVSENGVDKGLIAEEDVPAKRGADDLPAAQRLVVPLSSSEGRTGINTITVFAKDKDGNRVTENAVAIIRCFDCGNAPSTQHGSSLHTRAILGFEQTGGSGSGTSQKPFLDFFFSAPLIKSTDETPPPFSTWGSIRFASVPTQQLASGGLGLQNFAGSFLSNFQGVNVNEIVQGFDFLAGVDFRLHGGGSGRGYLSAAPGTFQKTSISLIAAIGAINPFNERQNAQIFTIPKINGQDDPEFVKLFPEAAGKNNIAFVTPERDRFFRQYYGGLRFKTFFFDKRGQVINTFPAILDVTVGQNEVVTGLLRNPVFRLEGFYPFPFKAAKFLYLYGTAMMKMGGKGAESRLPLFLAPATSITLPDPNTVIVPIDRNPNLRSTRDYYRIGVGINLIELLDKLRPASN